MQALAAELNYSETTFVLPPGDPANTARVRIFNRTSEMPFAGHPNVGTAYVLGRSGVVSGRTLRFEEPAGLVEVRLAEHQGEIVGAEIDAPQPLSLLGSLPVDDIADCLSLAADNIVQTRHQPIRASVGIEFLLVEVQPDALENAAPDISAFRRLVATHPKLDGRLSIFSYAAIGPDVRARMFAPLTGTWEDPATGSANAALAALRLQLSGDDEIAYQCLQGVEMGRESLLSMRAWCAPDGVRASVRGRCVEVFRGTIAL
jgi:trans-2,3-dihydro-3-hydroxyanthranilate isomerase